jgi:BirA family biotin operon repressor/biotin-[acetyl-CoA-carboxylase] ligase
VSLRADVLEVLREASGAPVSGEALARAHGVSRTAVAKHIAALRAEGYTIDAVPGSGYTLSSTPPLALPAEVAALAIEPMWVRFVGGEETGSTNDDCKRLARAGAPTGTVVVAARQGAGRGRLGRTWDSPAGGAYFSVLLRPDVAPAEVTALPLAIALGVARGLETLGVRCGLKWPNDVLLAGRKLAGVLLEMSAESDRLEWVVAGVGVNVTVPDRAFPEAAYVAEELPGAEPARVAAAVLDGIACAYARFVVGGFAALADEYAERSVLIGRTVSVSDIDGALRARGRVVGVDGWGRLLLDDGDRDGPRAISSGDVTLRRTGGAGTTEE